MSPEEPLRKFPPPRIDHEDKAEGYGCLVIVLFAFAVAVVFTIWGIWFA